MWVWQPGMHCVCVSKPSNIPVEWPQPVVGRVYTVRCVAICDLSGMTTLWLEEIDCRAQIGEPYLFDGMHGIFTTEPGWIAVLFRPLSRSRLDQFRSHLAPAPKAPVPA